MKTLRQVGVPPETYERLRALGDETLRACEGQLADGTRLWFPDSSGQYRGLWLRDFCYVVEGMGDRLDPTDLLRAIDLFIAGQLEDGSLPTRVMEDGVPDYREGSREEPLGAGPPTDNPQFFAKLLCAYANLSGDWRALRDRLDALEAAIRSLPLDREHLVHIDPNLPSSGYGFTDCVAKTGRALFSSVLLWEAYARLAETCRRWEMHDDAHDWYELHERMGDALWRLYVPGWRMFTAASGDCNQIDLWGSAYACVTQAASGSMRDAVAGFFAAHYDECVWHGHVRHLPAGQYWERMLKDVPRDEYQNGGYWAVPSGWAAQVLATADEGLAQRLVADVVAEFEEHGVHEWIHPQGGRHCRGYVASIACLLAAVRPASRKEKHGRK